MVNDRLIPAVVLQDKKPFIPFRLNVVTDKTANNAIGLQDSIIFEAA